jgi:hypothetical protein
LLQETAPVILHDFTSWESSLFRAHPGLRRLEKEAGTADFVTARAGEERCDDATSLAE